MDIKSAVQYLGAKFDSDLSFESVDIAFEKTVADDEEDEDERMEKLSVIKAVRCDEKAIDIFNEITSAVRSIRENETTTSSDNWKDVMDDMVAEEFCANFYALMSIGLCVPEDSQFRKISFLTAQTYVLLLALPGSQEADTFNIKLIRRSLDFFSLLLKVEMYELKFTDAQDKHLLEFQVMGLLDAFKLTFSFVSLEHHTNVRSCIIIAVRVIIKHYHVKGFSGKNSCEIFTKCYELLDVLVRTIHGSVEDSLWHIMCRTTELHQFEKAPKVLNCSELVNAEAYNCIADWFVSNIASGPTAYSAAMIKYIKCCLTNAKFHKMVRWETNLRVIAKYESGIVKICDTSIIEVLEKLSCSDSEHHRIKAVQCIFCMLNALLEYPDSSEIMYKREIAMLRILLEKISDRSGNVKVTVFDALFKVFVSNMPLLKKIISEVFMENCFVANFKSTAEKECQFNKPIESECSIPGAEALTDCLRSLLPTLYSLCNSQHGRDVKTKSFHLISILVQLNDTILYDSRFYDEFIRISTKPNATRNEALGVLKCWVQEAVKKKQSNPKLFSLWAGVILAHREEKDPKIIKILADSFFDSVIDKIKRFESTISEEDEIPWLLMRHLLLREPRGIVGKAVEKFLVTENRGLVQTRLTYDHVSALESHIDSQHSSESLVMLNLMSSVAKVRDPDSFTIQFLNDFFLKLSKSSEQNYLKLEVVVSMIPQLIGPCRRILRDRLERILLTFDVDASHVSRYFNACAYINRMDFSDGFDKWLEDFNEKVETVFFQSRKTLYISGFSDNRIINALLMYSEINTDRKQRPNQAVVKDVMEFLKFVINNHDRYQNDSAVMKINTCMLLLTRLAFRDHGLCIEVAPLLRNILRTFCTSVKILSNLFITLEDLSKRYANVVEPILNDMLPYCLSENTVLRPRALECVLSLLAQDFLKVRGLVYVYLLRVFVQGDPKYMTRINNLVLGHKVTKNPLFFRTSLWECLFIFNGYKSNRSFDLFDKRHINQQIPFFGPARAGSRLAIYRYFVYHLDDATLYSYFERVHWIRDSLKTNLAEIGRPEGMAAIRDFYLVCMHLVEARLSPDARKRAISKTCGQKDEDDDDGIEEPIEEPQDDTRCLERALPSFKEVQILLTRMKSPVMEEASQLWELFTKSFPDLVNYMGLPKSR